MDAWSDPPCDRPSPRSRAQAWQSLHLVSGKPLGAQAPDQRHSHERCPVAGVATVAGATLGDRSPCWSPHCPGMFGAGASLLFLQRIAVGGSGGALRSLPPTHPGRPATPGIALGVMQKSACAAGSIQWWVATCCRPRRARGRSWSKPRIRSWHSAGEDSRLQPHVGVAPSHDLSCPQPTALTANDTGHLVGLPHGVFPNG